MGDRDSDWGRLTGLRPPLRFCGWAGSGAEAFSVAATDGSGDEARELGVFSSSDLRFVVRSAVVSSATTLGPWAMAVWLFAREQAGRCGAVQCSGRRTADGEGGGPIGGLQTRETCEIGQ